MCNGLKQDCTSAVCAERWGAVDEGLVMWVGGGERLPMAQYLWRVNVDVGQQVAAAAMSSCTMQQQEDA